MFLALNRSNKFRYALDVLSVDEYANFKGAYVLSIGEDGLNDGYQLHISS